ncbi:MAG TPA: hypothetical protein VLE02_01665 [Nitrosarchaeum sp.]|nr:hypothetical protein [Nitrosarchaeum sp.]
MIKRIFVKAGVKRMSGSELEVFSKTYIVPFLSTICEHAHDTMVAAKRKKLMAKDFAGLSNLCIGINVDKIIARSGKTIDADKTAPLPPVSRFLKDLLGDDVKLGKDAVKVVQQIAIQYTYAMGYYCKKLMDVAKVMTVKGATLKTADQLLSKGVELAPADMVPKAKAPKKTDAEKAAAKAKAAAKKAEKSEKAKKAAAKRKGAKKPAAKKAAGKKKSKAESDSD